MKLIGIARVSTPAQAKEDRFGFAAQCEAIRSVAAREGVEPDDVTMVQVVVSGTSLDMTPEWMDIIHPAIRDKDTHVVCYHQDRLIRSDFGAVEVGVLFELKTTKTFIFTPQGKIDLHDPQDAMISSILAAVAGYERHRIRQRNKAGKRAAARRGHFPEGATHLPTGVEYDHATRTWKYNQDAAMVAEAFRLWYSEGVRSWGDIASRLGIPNANRPRKWFMTPMYKGIFTYADVQCRVFGGDGQEAQLVSDDVWEACNRGATQKNVQHRRTRADKADMFPFTGFLFTRGADEIPEGTFGLGDLPEHKMKGVMVGDKGYYRAERGEGLGRPRADLTNKAVGKYLYDLSRDQDYATALRGHATTSTEPLERKRDALRTNLHTVEQKLARLADLYIDGKIRLEHHDARKAKLDAELHGVRGALDDVTKQLGEGVAAEQVENLISGLQAFEASWGAEQIKSWLRAYCKGIRLSPEGVKGVLLRIPGADVPMYIGGHERTWKDLGVPNPFVVGRRERLGVGAGEYTTVEVAKMIGMHPADLRRRVREGHLPSPSKVLLRGKANPEANKALRWTDADVAAVMKVLGR